MVWDEIIRDRVLYFIEMVGWLSSVFKIFEFNVRCFDFLGWLVGLFIRLVFLFSFNVVS